MWGHAVHETVAHACASELDSMIAILARPKAALGSSRHPAHPQPTTIQPTTGLRTTNTCLHPFCHVGASHTSALPTDAL
jgi:hypothetical protein